jgi:hypothetical protein
MAGSRLIRTNTSKFASAVPGAAALGGILDDSGIRFVAEVSNASVGRVALVDL